MSITEEINHKAQPNLPSLSTHHTDFYVIFFYNFFSKTRKYEIYIWYEEASPYF